MTLDEAIRRNPYDTKRGNEAAYCRYLRYNVDGWYQLDSKEVLRRWQKRKQVMKEVELVIKTTLVRWKNESHNNYMHRI